MVTTLPVSLAEVAAWLVSSGTFTTLEEAYAYAPYWTQQAYAAWSSMSSSANIVSGGAAAEVVSTTETALELAGSAALQATNQEVKSTAIAIAQKGAGSFSYKAVLGMDMGIVAAAAAPVLGVALGVGWYASAPELWTKISQKLLPFCYPDTTIIPTWADIANTAWEVSIAKSIIDAIKQVFEEEGIPIGGSQVGRYGTATSSLGTVPISTGFTFSDPSSPNPEQSTYDVVSDGGLLFDYGEANKKFVSLEPFTVTRTRPWDGFTETLPSLESTIRDLEGRTVTYYYRDFVIPSGWDWDGPSPTDLSSDDATRTVLFGDVVFTPSEYPPGVSEWDGVIPSTIPYSDPIIVDDEGSVIDTVPISPPVTIPSTWRPGLPVPTGDPTVQPDPTEIVDPNKQVQPYFLPLPNPSDTIIPNPYPNSDPNDNPSDPTPPEQKIVDLIPLPPPSGISPWPDMPTTDCMFTTDVGLVTVYNPTSSELYAFERWLWVTLAQASIQTVWNNPFDGVITLFELYCDTTVNGRHNIKSGFLDSGVASDTISRYTEIDCGTLGIPEYYGNYLDYSPYSKAHIYLPFIGVQELNVDDIVGHCVNVTYRIDEYNGSCIAMITVAKVTTVNGEDVEYSNTMYQFSGNCAVELPISGGSQAQIKAGLMMADAYQHAANVSAGAQLLGGIASILSSNPIGGLVNGIGGAMGTYAYGQAQGLSNMLSGKSTVTKSGSFGASHGALGIKNPFITITRPKQIQVPNYEDLYGFPAHKMVTVGACTGFLRCREVHVVSSTASDDEKNMIESLLKSGVYVTE